MRRLFNVPLHHDSLFVLEQSCKYVNPPAEYHINMHLRNLQQNALFALIKKRGKYTYPGCFANPFPKISKGEVYSFASCHSASKRNDHAQTDIREALLNTAFEEENKPVK